MISKEHLDSATSYGFGAFSALIASLPQMATTAQSIAIILGAGVVAIRLAHDITRFYRYLKADKP